MEIKGHSIDMILVLVKTSWWITMVGVYSRENDHIIRHEERDIFRGQAQVLITTGSLKSSGFS
jgi:hypothetical protein